MIELELYTTFLKMLDPQLSINIIVSKKILKKVRLICSGI